MIHRAAVSLLRGIVRSPFPLQRSSVFLSHGNNMARSKASFSTASAPTCSDNEIPSWDNLYEQARGMHDFTVSARRFLHMNPELRFQEEKTSAFIQQTLTDLGVQFTTGWAINTNPDIPGEGGTGVVAEIGTGKSPCIALRGDIDALPIKEETQISFQSQVQGCMHACGHDGHTSMLLGAARLLKAHEDKLQGTVRLVFQPAEEGGAGAKRMVEEGVLDRVPAVDWMFGMHLWPSLPTGRVASRPGPIFASSDKFEVEIQGVGGHAAMPHLTVDPVVAAAAAVTALQTVVARNVGPLESGVVSVTQMSGSDTHNIIPAAAKIGGTIRALKDETMEKLRRRVGEVVRGVATAHGCAAEVAFGRDPYITVVNSEETWNFLKETTGFIEEIEPTLAGEDFGFFLQKVPGNFILLGQGSEAGAKPGQPCTTFGLHHPQFAVDERALDHGVALHAALALHGLRRLAAAGGGGGGPVAAGGD